MGKKYIIDLEDSESVYKTIITNGYPMLQVIVPAPYTEPDMEQVRKEAYEKGFKNAVHNCPGGCPYVEQARNEAYQRGLNDAWEAARKIILDKEDGGLDTVTYNEIFGYGKGVRTVLKIFTASEAIEKIRQYEQKQEQIRVGDEVIAASGKAVVTGVGPVYFEYVYANGHIGSDKVKNVKKTGRHFPEIAEVLRKMQEES